MILIATVKITADLGSEMFNDRTYCIIDLDILEKNFQIIKDRAKGKKIIVVVKANAYGHGAVEIAKFLDNKADFFGVATIDEAIELRQSGVCSNIIILGYTLPCDFKRLIAYSLIATIYSYRDAVSLNHVAKALNKKAYIHVAVDTGMSRIGFLPNEYGEVIKIARLSNIEIQGAFTHYSCADEKYNNYIDFQTALFQEFLYNLEKFNINIKITHASNSSAITCYNTPFNAVRAGIILYGMYPSSNVQKIGVKPILSWYAKIVRVKQIEKGSGVGYGRTYITTKTTKIATLSVGYADGFSVALSNKGRVIVGGEYANICGRVCMDQTMIVVDGISVKVGDDAILQGEIKDKIITVEEIGELSNSFNYERVCLIGDRVARYYLKGGEIIGRSFYVGHNGAFVKNNNELT